MKQIILILIIGAIVFNLFQSWCFGEEDVEDPDSSEHGYTAGIRGVNCSCGRANREMGQYAFGNEYPLMVGLVLKEKNKMMCGATILTRRHVITAGHCLEKKKPKDIGVFGGYYRYENGEKVRDLMIPERFIIHPKYISDSLKYDIAIILMENEIIFNIDVEPACLPQEKIPIAGQFIKLLGWGQTETKPYSDILMKVYVFGKSIEECKKSNPTVDNHHNCVFREHKGACNGDDGGPALWRDPDTNRYVLVGVMSQTYTCGESPAVNVDVYHFLPWIQRVISETGPNLQTCAKI